MCIRDSVKLLTAFVETAAAVGQHLVQAAFIDLAIAALCNIGGDFQQGQCTPHIAIGSTCDVGKRSIGNHQPAPTQALRFIVQRLSLIHIYMCIRDR